MSQEDRRMRISLHLSENQNEVQKQIENCADILFRPLLIGEKEKTEAFLIYIEVAVSANLVSPITVTVAALTALGSFSIPNEELSEVFRLWKYGILLLGSCFGILGVMLGCFLLLMLMAEQESYGIPWLYPYVGGNLNERADEKDSMFLAAARKRKRRPIFAKWGNRIRFRRKS